jgi:hypothetical protein
MKYFGRKDKGGRHGKCVRKWRRAKAVERVSQLYLEGLTLPKIVEKLREEGFETSSTSVHRYFAEAKEAVKKNTTANIEELTNHIFQRYELIYRETLEAWHSTKNPAFLMRAESVLGKICDLKGLNAPKRTELSGFGGGPIQLSAVQELTDDELIAIINNQSTGSGGRVIEATSSPVECLGVHSIHDGGLPCELAPSTVSEVPRQVLGGGDSSRDGIHSAATRQERTCEPKNAGESIGK